MLFLNDEHRKVFILLFSFPMAHRLQSRDLSLYSMLNCFECLRSYVFNALLFTHFSQNNSNFKLETSICIFSLSRSPTIKFLMTFLSLLSAIFANRTCTRKTSIATSTHMKDRNGHREVGTACDVESQSVSNAMKKLKILWASINDGNCWSLFFNLKRDLWHFLIELALLHNNHKASISFFLSFQALSTSNISAPANC